MSDILTKPSTTKEGQNNTQSGVLTLPDFNFSINCNFKINFDPETKALLTYALNLLEAHQPVCNVQQNANKESVIKLEDLPTDEPTELRPNIPEELVEPEKYGTIISANQIKWNTVPKHPEFGWREQGKDLIVKYSNLSHDTNWKKIADLLKFKGTARTEEIKKSIGSKTSKKISALNIFCRLVDEKVIKVPADPDKELDDFVTAFHAEEDPDAAFKPIVTPHISTRPDFENGGKVEGTLEV